MSATATGGKIVWHATESIGLVRVTPGRQLAAYVHGMVASYYVHWCKELRRTQPCILGGCIPCRDGEPRRSLSYCEAMVYRYHGDAFHWLPTILEIPYTTAMVLVQMRKQVVALRREKKCGPVNVGTYLFEVPTPRPVTFDIVSHLVRLWRLPQGAQLALIGNLGPAND